MGTIVRNNSFSVYRGPDHRRFGLIGSGRTETFKVVAGIYKRDFLPAATIELDGRPVRYDVPRERCGTASSMSPRTARPKASSRPCRSRRISIPACSPPASSAPLSSACARCRRSPGVDRPLKIKRDQRKRARRRAVRRQPAEGGDRQGPDPEAPARSSSTSRRAASMSAPSLKSISSSTGSPMTGWR